MLVSISHCNYYIPLYPHYILIIYILISSLYPHYWFLCIPLYPMFCWVTSQQSPSPHYQAVFGTRPRTLGFRWPMDASSMIKPAASSFDNEAPAAGWKIGKLMKPWLTVKPWEKWVKTNQNPGKNTKIAGIHGCSSPSKWYLYRYWPIPMSERNWMELKWSVMNGNELSWLEVTWNPHR